MLDVAVDLKPRSKNKKRSGSRQGLSLTLPQSKKELRNLTKR